jgi:hypothetical protein
MGASTWDAKNGQGGIAMEALKWQHYIEMNPAISYGEWRAEDQHVPVLFTPLALMFLVS